jgi:hypothetical protein
MYNIRIYALNLDNSDKSVKLTKSCRDFIQTKLQESDKFIKFTKSEALNGSEAVTKTGRKAPGFSHGDISHLS